MTKSTQLPPNGISWNLVFEKQSNSDHDLTALLTKVRLDESISMFVNKAFTDDWFNKTYVLKRQKDQLAKLLEIATIPRNSFSLMVCCTNKQMEWLWASLLVPSRRTRATSNMCHLEEKLTRDVFLPHLYKRWVDDTLARMPITNATTMFRTILNGLHPSLPLTFTMELPVNNRICFICIEIIKNGAELETQVDRNSKYWLALTFS